MKKFLFTLAFILPLVFAACSSDDEKQSEELTKSKIVGTWSTETTDPLQYIDFKEDNTGYYGKMRGATIIKDYAFDYTLSGNEITVKPKNSSNETKVWKCQLYGNTLKITNETEAGVYKKTDK